MPTVSFTVLVLTSLGGSANSIMQVLILTASLFAMASAGFYGNQLNAGYGYGNNQGASYGLGHGAGHVSSHGEGIFYDGSKGYHIPVIHDGVPLETPEVVAAKKHHYAALAEAYSKSHGSHDEYDNGNSGNGAGNIHYGAGNAAGAYGSNYGLGLGHVSSHGEGIFYDGSKGYHIPVIHDGVPLETPEVVAAKKHHFAALAEARSRSHGKHGGYHH